jgi:hypothetical protein
MYHGLWVLHHGHRCWVQCVGRKARVLQVSRMGRSWAERRVTIVGWDVCCMGGNWLSHYIVQLCRWHAGNLSLTLNPYICCFGLTSMVKKNVSQYSRNKKA